VARAADQACKPYLARAFTQLFANPTQRARHLRQLVLYTECMRSHGIDLRDPSGSGILGSGILGSGILGSGASQLPHSVRNSPEFAAARSACAGPKSRRAAGR
jgi:hypothetical protein